MLVGPSRCGFARQSGCIEVVDRVSFGVQQIKTLQYHPEVLVNLEPNLPIEGHRVIGLLAIVFN